MAWNSDTYYGGSGSSGYSSYYRKNLDPAELAKALEPVIRHLTMYDDMRVKLETRGGHIRDISKISAHLAQPVVTNSEGREYKLSLIDPDSARSTLREIGHWDLHFAVRILETQMPAYYICRTHSDYWSDYTMIMEDLYCSPGYPMVDERFVKLMRSGHESFHLRLSPFSERLKAVLGKDNKKTRKKADRILRDIGKEVFQAAWHEDQRLAFSVSSAFNVPGFRDCIELLYLCLNGDLFGLRRGVEDQMLDFFRSVYPQPAIHDLLKLLPLLDGRELNALPDRALEMYAKLSESFSRLLHVETEWGRMGSRMPIYKLVFANVNRMQLIGEKVKDLPEVRDAVSKLDKECRKVIAEIVTDTLSQPKASEAAAH